VADRTFRRRAQSDSIAKGGEVAEKGEGDGGRSSHTKITKQAESSGEQRNTFKERGCRRDIGQSGALE